jgi:hypothetical protein
MDLAFALEVEVVAVLALESKSLDVDIVSAPCDYHHSASTLYIHLAVAFDDRFARTLSYECAPAIATWVLGERHCWKPNCQSSSQRY